MAVICTLLSVWAGSSTVLWAAAPAQSLHCDDSIKTKFKPDMLTSVVLVRAFKKGEPLQLSAGEPSGMAGLMGMPTPAAQNDLCVVKLMVGPGNPGPADAPSTSRGIGIEIWLPTPANWNGRVHAIGGGGWAGGPAGLPAAIADTRPPAVAGTEGAVSSVTDTGHTPGGGSFAMNPDGTVNEALWRDFATRAIHEQADKTKALAKAYYGRAPKFSYWDGASTGGRQALDLAQNNPTDFDGIVGSMPAINWTRFITAALYPQLVFLHDLGGRPITEQQQDFVSNAAIKACDLVGGQHLGYILDPSTCRYDPTKDSSVLCKADGGENSTPLCVTKLQADAFNKFWYGLTSDGSVPSPAEDNGWDKELGGVRRWYGLARGTSLYDSYYTRLSHAAAGETNASGAWPLITDQVALDLLNPTIAQENFKNASGNGQSLWKTLSYVQLANAFDRGVALNPIFGRINSDNPDLSAFKAHGGKMLTWHGINDEMIPVQGTIRYYKSVMAIMGGLANVQSFYRLYLIPGNGHGAHNGTSNPDANPPEAPELYSLLVNWVEKGIAPERVDMQTPATAAQKTSMPACPYPQKAIYVSGDPKLAASYTCS
jgi:feruloyl esterase